MPAKHRDVSEDDYPTGPIDIWPLLAQDAPAEAFVVDDNGAAHDKRNGRFTKKGKTMPRKVWTWADVKDMVCGPDQTEGPNIFEWPDEPGVEWETESFANGAVTVSKIKGVSSSFRVESKRDRKVIPPEPAVIRAWAQRSGIPVSAKGKLSQAVIDAYMKARA